MATVLIQSSKKAAYKYMKHEAVKKKISIITHLVCFCDKLDRCQCLRDTKCHQDLKMKYEKHHYLIVPQDEEINAATNFSGFLRAGNTPNSKPSLVWSFKNSLHYQPSKSAPLVHQPS